MDFEFSDEQRMLGDSIARYVGDQSPLNEAGKRREETLEAKKTRWQAIEGLGLLALPFAECDGGIGGGGVDLSIVMEAFGSGLVGLPYLSSVVGAGRVLAALGSDTQKQKFLQPLISGKMWLSVAHAERPRQHRLTHCKTTAQRDGDSFIIDGDKTFIVDGGLADAYILVARSNGEAEDADGLSGFILPSSAPGLSRTPYQLADGSIACELSLKNVRLDSEALLGGEGGFLPVLRDAAAATAIAACSEAIGIADALVKVTVEHLRTRRQFGASLGSFQAIQHRMAEAFLGLEMARSITLKAMLTDARENQTEWWRIAAGAKALVTRQTMTIAEESVQFHGAMGITEELVIGHYLKRLMVLGRLFGDMTAELDRCNYAASERTV